MFALSFIPRTDNKAPNGLGCVDVALFWRYNNMIKQTANLLRIDVCREMAVRSRIELVKECEEDCKMNRVNLLRLAVVTWIACILTTILSLIWFYSQSMDYRHEVEENVRQHLDTISQVYMSILPVSMHNVPMHASIFYK